MLDRTDTAAAPWHVIPGDDKHYARLAVVETVCDALETALTR
jgi:polyphosphate kinase 2 (PPK2 family)